MWLRERGAKWHSVMLAPTGDGFFRGRGNAGANKVSSREEA